MVVLWQMPNHVTRCEKIWIEVRECGSGIHEHAGLPFFIPNPQTCTNVLQSLVSLIIRVTTQNHLPISDVYSESIRSVDGLSGRCLLHMFILSDSPSHSLSNLYARVCFFVPWTMYETCAHGYCVPETSSTSCWIRTQPVDRESKTCVRSIFWWLHRRWIPCSCLPSCPLMLTMAGSEATRRATS